MSQGCPIWGLFRNFRGKIFFVKVILIVIRGKFTEREEEYTFAFV